MALVPELIYDDIVETLRGKTRNYRGGSDYLLNFTMTINTDHIFEIGDIIEIDVTDIDESVNVSKATAIVRDVFTWQNGVTLRFYFWAVDDTYEGTPIKIYTWESYWHYPDGYEKKIGQSTTSLFNERALVGFLKTGVIRFCFMTDFYVSSQTTGGAVVGVTPADSFKGIVLQPSSNTGGINIFDNVRSNQKYYIRRVGEVQPVGSSTDLFKYAYCEYTGINNVFIYNNLETMLEDLNLRDPDNPMTPGDVYKPGKPDPSAPVQDDDPSTPGGGGGNYDSGSDPVDFPTLPTGGAITSGAVRAFKMNNGQLDLMFRNLWDSSFFDILTDFQKLVDSPLDALVSLHCIPIEPTIGTTTDVLLGSFDTGVNAPLITQQYMAVDMGTLLVKEFWGSALDYSPYTKCEIYLPAVGFRELKIEDVMTATLHIKYMIDILTGDCIAMIKCGQAVLYKFRGNLKETVPVTSRVNEASFNLMKAGAGIITGAAMGGAAGAAMGLASAAPQVSASKTHTTRTGDLGGSISLMDEFVPYIIIHRPIQSLAEDFRSQKGYPANLSRKLSSCQGYTEVDYIHLTGISATDTELTEIETLLKNGVII